MIKKIKVLRIITRLNVGGPAIHTILLTEGLDKDRFNSVLVTGLTDEYEGDMSHLLQKTGVEPLFISQIRREVRPIRDVVALWKIFCLIRKEKPDIIHTHTAKAGTLGRLAGILYNLFKRMSFRPYRRCRLVHTFHGHVLHSYFSKTENRFYGFIERLLGYFTDKILAVSESVKEDLISFKVAPPDKIISIPLGLDLDKFLDIESTDDYERDYKLITIVGRLVPVKNHKMFLEAALQVKDGLLKEKSGPKARFLVAGDGPLRPELEEYSKELGIDKDIIFLGWERDVSQIYRQTDIVTLTSLNEGTPVALIEAQASGKTCVATDVGGVSDVIENGESGFLVKPGDVEGFSKSVIKLIKEPELAKKMGKRGRERIRSKFDKDRLIEDIENLYMQLQNG